MSTATAASLVRMANQIAANYRHHGPDRAAGEVAQHLQQFWAGPMLSELQTLIDAGGTGLDPVVLAAAGRLRSS